MVQRLTWNLNTAIDRRQFFCRACGLTLGIINSPRALLAVESSPPTLKTRGVVLVPEDLSLVDWPERARGAGLTTIALHHGAQPREVMRFVQSSAGERFLKRCHELGLQVEYELHAVNTLLPRDWFTKDKTLFRMNEQGERVRDANLCVHSPGALDIACQQALRLVDTLRPTTARYFLWGDDAQPWCRCPRCLPFSDSDQALILENQLIHALRTKEPKAQLAHLAYANTLFPPRRIKPEPGVFLEYAPIQRRYDIPYAQQSGPAAPDGIAALDANLKIFPTESAQILEYWLDVSRVSGWRKPAAALPWHREVFLKDVAAYRARGIRHITSFAVWIDADYVHRFGEPSFVREYGAGLRKS